MGRLSAKNQLYIGIALLVVISVAAVFLLILPVYQEAASLGSQISAEKTNLATAQALLARRQSAKAQAASNEVDLMRVANQVPDSPQLPSVIIEIQDLANAADLSLETIAPTEMKPMLDANGAELGYSEVPMDLSLRGEWDQMISFFQALAGLDRGVRIKTVDVTYVAGDAETKPYMDAKVGIAVYVMAAATTDKGSASTTGTVAPVTNK